MASNVQPDSRDQSPTELEIERGDFPSPITTPEAAAPLVVVT
jgi:hypothetical protein